MSVPGSRSADHRRAAAGRGGRRSAARGADARRGAGELRRDGRGSSSGPVDEVHSVEDRDADGVPVRIYRPVETSEPSRALVYFHGGGWVVGSIETHDGISRALAKRTPCVVISVDYRLAPGAPVPGRARRRLEGGELGVRRTPPSSASTRRRSASAATASAAASRRSSRAAAATTARPFAAQLLIYPTTTRRQATPSYSYFALGYGLTRDAMAWYWKQYLGDYDGSDDPDVSPNALQDMRRLPRAIVVTAEADVLRDEAETYAQRLFLSGHRDRGLPVRGHDPRLPAHGRGRRPLATRRSTRSRSRSGRSSTRAGGRTSASR